jgi:hypothetical protein
MLCLFVGDDVPIRLLLDDGASNQYPQAVITDGDGNVLTTLTLSHEANGVYKPSSEYSMPDEVFITAVYIVYTDVGHSTESAVYPRAMDVFYQSTLNNLSTAEVNAEMGTVLNTYDPPTKAELDAAVASLAIEANIEGHVSTALTNYDPPTKAELDTAVSNLTTEIDANETKLDTIQADLDNPDQYKADVSGLAPAGEYDDQMARILGLVQENFRLRDQVYNGDGNMTSATIRIYASAVDCNNDENAIAEYTITATYNVNGECVSYKVVKT